MCRASHPLPSSRVISALAALALVLAGCGLLDSAPDPDPAAEAFAQGWQEGGIPDALLAASASAETVNEILENTAAQLGGDPIVEVRTVERDEQGDGATARLALTWTLPAGAWSYETTVPLVLGQDEEGWQVVWSTSVLHPELTEGQWLRSRSVVPERATILDADDQPLFTPLPVVHIGVEPQAVENLDQVLAVLADLVGIDPGPLRERVEAAAPDVFVDVITLRQEDFEPVRAALEPVPGLLFREGERPLAPTTGFARALLGRVGAPTAEVLEEARPGFGPGDELGLSGLQRQFQEQLSGRPGSEVVVVSAEGEALGPVYETAPNFGAPLRTTLVPEIQNAADAAVVDAATPSMIVAIRPSSGEVVAVAHGPDGGGANSAFTGQYPPGSSFKVVTSAALFAAGVEADEMVECPETATIFGRSFRNAEGGAFGTVPYREAFARSCNTTFVELTPRLPDEVMAQAAGGFGFGGDWSPGIPGFTGQVPPPQDDVERAASMIGQGRVLASPLLMASVTAAVADGNWRPPVLLPDHAQPGAGPVALDPATVDALQEMMRQVVEAGTGTTVAGVPGEPVHAKTGTAEYGDEDPPRTHAWFIGYQGDLAFAVLVEDGEAGGSVAGPVAARFLEQFPRG
ncbi:MAG: penicillin-binding protein [Nitriliruptorales bacterium]|nr:penicillin-binding protein [Nitriliruptorales bacterium]